LKNSPLEAKREPLDTRKRPQPAKEGIVATLGLNIQGLPLCDNHNANADRLESLVWTKVEKILSDPEVVYQELMRRQGESDNCKYLEGQLEQVEVKLSALEKRVRRLTRALGFGLEGEQYVAEKGVIAGERRVLLEEKESLKKQLETSRECRVDFDGVLRFCGMIWGKLANF
jgi:hypothetical protein